MITCRTLALSLSAVVVLGAAPARAQSGAGAVDSVEIQSNGDTTTTQASADTGSTLLSNKPVGYRSMGIAELGLGWLVLPGAKVCSAQNNCKSGDSSPMIEVWPLVRPTPRFAVGAGISLGLVPTTDAPRQDPPGVQRSHSRGYLTVESIGRYYPIIGPHFEAWTGLTAGFVVVSDTFQSKNGLTDKALVGPRGVTIRTEGYTIGLAAGGTYRMSRRWSVGATLRYGAWLLPGKPATDPLGDQASLVGRNNMFSLSLDVAYRTLL